MPMHGWEGGILPSNRVMKICRWIRSHFHDWYDSCIVTRVTRMGSQIFGILGVNSGK